MKKWLSLLYVFVFITVVTAFSVNAEIVSGNCGVKYGDNVKWELDTESGVLTISGNGSMANYGDGDGKCDGEDSHSPSFFSKRECISTIVIKNGVTSLGRSAFRCCTNLTNVIIADSVKEICDYAFSGCTKLTDITWPDSINSIGSYAFSDTGLKSVFLKNIDVIENGAFLSCNSLIDVVLENVQNIGELENGSRGAFGGCDNLTNLTISGYNVVLGDYAFSECISLSNITLNNVQIIGEDCFYACENLASIALPDSVTTVGDYAFYVCTNLTSVTLSKNITSFGDCVFANCPNLTEIYNLPKCVLNEPLCDQVSVRLDSGKFEYAPLKNISIVDGATSICADCFKFLTNLTNITIPESVVTVGQGAFDNTAWYNNQPDGVVYAGKNVYKYKGTMPPKTKIVIKQGTVSIVDRAFSYCNNLVDVTLPNSVTSIGACAFLYCLNLESVTIPDSVKYIGELAFFRCALLSAVYITDISAWCNIDFASNYKYDEVYNYSSPFQSSESDIALYLDGEKITDLIIPDDITSISSNAFWGNKALTSITIPTSVTNIQESAFECCYRLTDIYYRGTKDEWEKIKYAPDPDPNADDYGKYDAMRHVTIHYDYEAVRITFSSNTTDTVSSLPDDVSAVGAYTLPSVIPMRSGYAFLGWSTTPNGKATYHPGDTVEISADTTFYAVWAEADKVALSGITLKNTAYDPISTIPTGDFIAEVALTNNAYNGVCNILLATYDADGRMLHVRYVYANPVLGQSLTFGTEFSGADGKIAKIKAFALSDLRTFSVLCPSAEWSSDGQ